MLGQATSECQSGTVFVGCVPCVCRCFVVAAPFLGPGLRSQAGMGLGLCAHTPHTTPHHTTHHMHRHAPQRARHKILTTLSHLKFSQQLTTFSATYHISHNSHTILTKLSYLKFSQNSHTIPTTFLRLKFSQNSRIILTQLFSHLKFSQN